jgi:hypothetical protein
VKASNGRKHKNKRLSTAKRNRNKQILPALVAVGGACGLATTPASALELGEITVDSSLGQPLRASIAYALNPNEQMFDFCIFLKPGMTANGIPTVQQCARHDYGWRNCPEWPYADTRTDAGDAAICELPVHGTPGP